MQQIDEACGLLLPIKDKIIGATTGNHEARAYRSDGIDMTRLVCRQLGVEQYYHPDGVLMFVRFGRRNPHECGGGNLVLRSGIASTPLTAAAEGARREPRQSGWQIWRRS